MLNSKGIRELAYVVTIKDVQPIEGYDRVEEATINGWHCVVGKGDFKPGDKAVYFEVDSLLPPTKFADFEFLAKKHFKVKTQKMCNRISQGLILTFEQCGLDGNNYNEGDFLTDVIGVVYADPSDNTRKGKGGKKKDTYNQFFTNGLKKYKILRLIVKTKIGHKICLFLFKQKKKSEWPAFVIKTDEERCLSPKSKIMTEEGEIEISHIVNTQKDVKVLSVNLDGELEYQKIIGYQKIPINQESTYEIGFKRHNNQSSRIYHIGCTGDHRFYTDKGYIEAKKLSVSDYLCNEYIGCNLNCISALYGMLLGDGCYTFDRRSNSLGRFSWTQSYKHSEYIDYIKRLFDNQYKEYRTKSGYNDDNSIAKLIFDRNPVLESYLIYDNAIKESFKFISSEYCERISPLGLALWYMDDGTIKKRINKNEPDAYIMEIATNAYSEEENRNLVSMLRTKYDIHCKYYLTNKGYYQIYIYNEGTIKLTEIIGKYVPTTMRYKLNPEVEEKYPFEEQEPFSFDNRVMIPTQIKEIKVHTKKNIPYYLGNKSYVYDITVEKNHNFFVGGILSHNCQNLSPSVFQDKQTTYECTEKRDGTSTTMAIQRSRRGYKVWVCSRNVVIFDGKTVKKGGYYDDTVGTNPYIHSEEQFHILDFLKDYMDKNEDIQWAYLQGETFGKNIQKRDYGLSDSTFEAFNFVDSVNGKCTYTLMKYILEPYNIPVVPILKTEFILPNTCDEIVAMAAGESEIYGGMREGIVFRCEQNPRFSFKAVDPTYLMKYH